MFTSDVAEILDATLYLGTTHGPLDPTTQHNHRSVISTMH